MVQALTAQLWNLELAKDLQWGQEMRTRQPYIEEALGCARMTASLAQWPLVAHLFLLSTKLSHCLLYGQPWVDDLARSKTFKYLSLCAISHCLVICYLLLLPRLEKMME